MRATDRAALARRIAGFAVVTCDIFDTAVLRRLARPQDVLLAAGARARAKQLVSCDPAAFREYRLEAERSVRAAAERDGRDEPRIAGIYAHLQACGIVTDPTAVAAVEFAAEQSACRPIEAVRAALAARDPAQRLAFVSDSVWPADRLAALLSGCGFGEGLQVFSSADFGLSKHTGRLFPAVVEALGCPAAAIVHIGDNEMSDITQAKKHGLATVHLPWVPSVPEPAAVAKLHPVVRLARSHRRARAAPVTPASPLARYFAMVLIGFSLFVLAEARRRGIRRIVFLARDGYLPLAVARRIAARSGEDFEFSYLHVSRQSIVVPSMADRVEDLADDMAGSMQGRKLSTALEFLGVDAERTAVMLRAIGLDPEQALTGLDPVRRLFAAQAPLVAERLAAVSQAAVTYLDRRVRRAGQTAGGGCRLARFIAGGTGRAGRTARAGRRRLLYRPVAAGAAAWPGTNQAAGYLFAFGHPRPLMDMVREGYILLELLFSAPHGSVLGYTEAGEPVHAIEAEPGGSLRKQALAALEADCLAEFDALDELLNGAWPDEIDPESALFDLAGLLTRPTADEGWRWSTRSRSSTA